MDEALHPRKIQTRRALSNALARLILRYGYDDITVRAVTQTAKVSYASFYRHFKSLDDLLEHILVPVFTEMWRQISEQDNLYDEAVVLYSFVRDHRQRYRVAFSLPPKHPLMRRLNAESLEYIRERCEQRDQTQVPFSIAVSHVLDTSHRLMAWYVNHVDEYTPEEVAGMHLDLVVRGTTNAVLNLRDGILEKHPD